ncbi:MAG: cytidylate kinase-like family protein [Fretibacterium sp.]|nr:cytidylate kinase-like family protein [Fretibacterium sp.]
MKRLTITISREFGSGGRLIGEKLAKQLNFSFFDRSLLSMAAKESGLAPFIFEGAEDEAANKLLFNLAIGGYVSTGGFAQANIPLSDQVFLAQSETILRLGKEGGCVLIGRCGNYALRKELNCLKVFIYAPLAERVRHVAEREKMSLSEAEALVGKMDKGRTNYYEHYTDWRWGDARSYDLALDSFALGWDLSIKLIQTAAEALAAKLSVLHQRSPE